MTCPSELASNDKLHNFFQMQYSPNSFEKKLLDSLFHTTNLIVIVTMKLCLMYLIKLEYFVHQFGDIKTHSICFAPIIYCVLQLA